MTLSFRLDTPSPVSESESQSYELERRIQSSIREEKLETKEVCIPLLLLCLEYINTTPDSLIRVLTKEK